jgi:RHH-type rel operon transcriptional repressor/antitoxin RelB
MAQTATMTVRLPIQVMARLESLAKSTDRSKAYLTNRAIEEYLETQAWQIKAIEEAIREADSGYARFIEHEEVVAKLKKSAVKSVRGKKR